MPALKRAVWTIECRLVAYSGYRFLAYFGHRAVFTTMRSRAQPFLLDNGTRLIQAQNFRRVLWGVAGFMALKPA